MSGEQKEAQPRQLALGLKSPRKLKPAGKSILTNRQTGAFKIYYDGVNVTPEPLNPLMIERKASGFNMERLEMSHSAAELKLFQSASTSRFHTELHRQTLQGESFFNVSYLSGSYVDDIVIEPAGKESPAGSAIDETAAAQSPPEEEVPKEMPSHITVVLSETPTYFLFELPSKTVEEDSKEAKAIQEQNALYEYLTEGKGRNRKVVHVEVQTVPILLKTRTTDAERIRHKHNHTFASNWEMYDTYEKEDEIEVHLTKDFLDEETGEAGAELQQSLESSSIPNEECMLLKLMQNQKFLEAVCVVERLLANNNFNEQQKRFRGLSDPNPFREEIEYQFRLDLLWTFANINTKGRCVSALAWNEDNSDILAVGYGKFYYKDVATGMVMVWNVKNPVQPERTYNFASPVTAVNFSKQNPNVLGVGFYDGTIKLLDISAREIRVLGKSSSESPSFEPIWQVAWCRGSDYFKDEEQVVATCQDGRISRFRMQDTAELTYTQIMRIPRPEGKLKGIKTLRRCHVPGIPITRYAAALVIQEHPADQDIYYIGTSEGTIHKCSRNYHHQHLDLFLAHDGPLYVIKFSPFCNKIFLTCGDDWNVRIWVDEPLFEFSKGMMSVQGADWCPTHSTVIANICGNDICIWDMQRKTYLPQSITTSPTNCRNTVIQFSKSGRCLVVGDIEGNVHVFALEDMPFPPFFQDDLLTNSILRGLITSPDLVRQLKKIGNLNFEENELERSEDD